MWNSPLQTAGTPGYQFTPRQTIGFLKQLGDEMEYFVTGAGDPPLFMCGATPFADIDPEIILWETLKLMEILVSPEQVPAGGHNALQECILHKLCKTMLEVGRDWEDLAAADEETKRTIYIRYYLEPINSFRKLAKLPPVENLQLFSDESWDKTQDAVFFFNRNWLLGAVPYQLQIIQTFPSARETLGIDANYFSAGFRRASRQEWDEANRRFQLILDHAEKSNSPLPPDAFITSSPAV
jgi:hypothetical protein